MSVPEIPGIKAGEDLARVFRNEVANLLHRSSPNFPGAQPVSFARKHLDELQRADYYLCEKTDGIRCLLYCTVGDQQEEIHYLIDRKNDYYFVQGLHLPHADDQNFVRFHQDTILDGELVLDTVDRDGTKKLRFLIFDCLVIDGDLLIHKPLDKRLGRLHTYIMAPYEKFAKWLQAEHPEDWAMMPFEVRTKKMEKAYGLEMMFRDVLPNLPHGNDGLVFTCKESMYVSGTDEHILKWKPAHENSIDFRLCLGEFPTYDPEDGEPGVIEDFDEKPTMDLLVHHGSKDDRFFASLFITDDEWESMKSMNQVLDGRIIECYKDSQGRWRFKREPEGHPRFRDDKTEANYIKTVDSVLQSIEDGVSEKELRDAAPAISRAWNHRNKPLPPRK